MADGRWDDQFPIDMFQTGSGTSTNMNANEVIATLAAERLGRPVHPNDEVNASQSSNDVFPTAIHVAAAVAARRDLLPALDHLAGGAATSRPRRTPTSSRPGRTHLMDATPVTLGQELGGYATQVEPGGRAARAPRSPRVGEVPLGGTATGTGLNAPAGFAARGRRAGWPSGSTSPLARGATTTSPPRAPATRWSSLSGELRALAAGAPEDRQRRALDGVGPEDRAWPRSACPTCSPGSSIMPGKVNPVIPEAVSQVVAQVYGNDAAVAFAGSQGNFELNVYLPVIARNLLESIRLLATVSRLFADRCLAGIEADVERCRAYAEATPQAATALNRLLGYERWPRS